ncbi:MAG: stimulus-sensing domain-containing protein [Pseudomonadota bacterium]
MSIKHSTKSKPFTASDIATKSSKFFPLFKRRAPDIDPKDRYLIEKRWSASSERVSSLTVRILGVNIIAIMILGIGILYLGQYTESLVERELQSMRAEARFMSGALSEGAVRPVFQISPIPLDETLQIEAIKPRLARRMVRRLGNSGTSRLILFGVDGTILADTEQLSEKRSEFLQNQRNDGPLTIGRLFDQSANRFLQLIPSQTKLEDFPQELIGDVFAFPDSKEAMVGSISTSAWEARKHDIVLTAAAPIQTDKQVLGVVLMLRDGTQLEEKIAEIRVDVFRVFLGSLGITVMLSIYLSGLIGRPLKKLALAAEAVRTGKGGHTEIPDMSDRGDEIGELSLVLRDMTEALWDRMDTIERFAADVSHEIKNPLTSLRSAVETASKIKDEEKREKLMAVIHHDVQRLDRLISDISNASRLDAELTRDEMSSISLADLLYRLRDAYKNPLDRVDEKENAGKIEVNILPGIQTRVFGNEDRLSQVFGNLISNALSFSPKDKPIIITVKRDGKHIVTTVEDSGPGIPTNKLETVFERFYTERPQTEDYGGHSGLGLSISKQIIDAHEGKIFAENITEKNKTVGARFTVKLRAA